MAEYKANLQNTLLNDAIALATMAHRNQIRKDPSEMPYIVHPLHVMQLLIDHGVTNKLILASAVLHDVVEDTGISLEHIELQFSQYVAWTVALVSKDPADSSLSMHEKSALGHASTMEKIEKNNWNPDFGNGDSGNPGKLLKIADRLSNLMGAFPENWDIAKHEQYYEQSREIAELGENWEITQSLKDATKEYAIYISELRGCRT